MDSSVMKLHGYMCSPVSNLLTAQIPLITVASIGGFNWVSKSGNPVWMLNLIYFYHFLLALAFVISATDMEMGRFLLKFSYFLQYTVQHSFSKQSNYRESCTQQLIGEN